jgi:hypothetical protein
MLRKIIPAFRSGGSDILDGTIFASVVFVADSILLVQVG